MLYTSIFLLVLFVPVNLACSCLAITNQEAFNGSDIVAHVTIQSKTRDSGLLSNIHYKIHYNETFKPHMPNNPRIIVPLPLPNDVITGANSAACGVDGMEVGQDYLIAGLNVNRSLAINLCSPLTGIRWSLVDKELLSNLRGGFRKMNKK